MSILLNEDIETIFLNTKKISKSLENKTILITGGNGFLGQYFVELFKKYNNYFNKKIKILVYDNNLKKNSNEPSNNTRYIKHDVSNKIITRIKIDIIIHAAGIASPYYYRKKPIETLDVAINGTKNCLDIA